MGKHKVRGLLTVINNSEDHPLSNNRIFMEVNNLLKISIAITHNMINKRRKLRISSKTVGKTFGIQVVVKILSNNKSRAIIMVISIRLKLIRLIMTTNNDPNHNHLEVLLIVGQDTNIQEVNIVKIGITIKVNSKITSSRIKDLQKRKRLSKSSMKNSIRSTMKEKKVPSNQQVTRIHKVMTQKAILINSRKIDSMKNQNLKPTNLMSLMIKACFINLTEVTIRRIVRKLFSNLSGSTIPSKLTITRKTLLKLKMILYLSRLIKDSWAKLRNP